MNPRLLLLSLFLAAAGAAAGQESSAPPAAAAAARPSLRHRLIWYLPNRFLDLADMVRARVRVGPGLALNLRATRWATLYAGEYHSVFLGFPGPRGSPAPRLPAGREQEKGVGLLGVDATDTLPYEPAYSPSEFTVGVHLLAAGAEAGFDPVEAADFLLGFFLIDPRRDDH